jgi:hypothetical protein
MKKKAKQGPYLDKVIARVPTIPAFVQAAINTNVQ